MISGVLQLLQQFGGRALGAGRRMRVGYRGHGVPEDVVQAKLEAIYSRADPWSMDSAREQYRFAATNDILRSELLGGRARFESLLEIGCGEGHQTLHLRPLCERYTGIDVVEAAVARARVRVPDGEFIVGDLRAQPWAADSGRFDLVMACEVLFCFADIPATLERMSRLGSSCLVTYHHPAAHLMERPLAKLPGVRRAQFRHEATVWHAAWWRGDSP